MSNLQSAVRQALGDPSFSNFGEILAEHDGTIESTVIQIPFKTFKGLPDQWIVVNVQFGKTYKSLSDAPRLISNRITKIRHSFSGDDRPILLILQSSAVLSKEEFAQQKNVVVLTDNDLAGADKQELVRPQTSPLAHAIRKMMPGKRALMPALQLYRGSQPVHGWRFIGREYELERLVHTDQSFIVAGARRIGKTSLLQEARRQIENNNEHVVFLDVQDFKTTGDVVRYLIQHVEEHYEKSLSRRLVEFDERPLDVVLRRLCRQFKRPTFIFDEMGNVIEQSRSENWNFFGTLRKFVNAGEIRVIISCFQQAYLAQQASYKGPLVNFGNEMHLTVLSNDDAEELVIKPWGFWNPIPESELKEMRKILRKEIGTHPLILQFVGENLFKQQTESEGFSPLTALKNATRKDIHDCFEKPIEQLFYNVDAPTIKYLFLRACYEGLRNKQELSKVVISEEWIYQTVNRLGYEIDTNAKQNLMTALEFYGYCCRSTESRSVLRLSAPIVYRYINKMNKPIESLISSLRKDIARDYARWDLTPQ